jgi:hypothetical protein
MGLAALQECSGDCGQRAKFSIHPIETLRWYFRAAAHKVALRQI